MIGRRFALAASVFLCFFCTSTMASEIQSDIGTYKKTRTRLNSVITDMDLKATSWIFRSRFNGMHDRKHYNGKRDTILFVPHTSIPDDITLVVWFHGLGGFSKKTFRRVLTQVKEISRDGHSIAISIPEMPWSTNTSTKGSRQGKVWKYPGDFRGFIDENKSKLASWALLEHGTDIKNIRIVVVGHSAGGSAINAASEEGSLCAVNPEVVIWSDASYGHWLQRAWSGCIANSGIEMHLLVRKWDRPYQNASEFMEEHAPDPKRVKYQILNRKQWHHGDIGNRALILTDVFPPGR